MVRRSYTALLERGQPLGGDFATEPHEAGWASEGLFFLRVVDAPVGTSIRARIQISPDGIHWVDEGTKLTTLDGGLVFARVREFGNWLRIVGCTVPDDSESRVLIYLALKE